MDFDLKKYKKQGKIGFGNFSNVFKVKEDSTGNIYAAKISKFPILNENELTDGVQLHFREVNLMASLNHPAVIKFIGYSSTDFEGNPNPTIVTELAVNGCLEKILEKEQNGLSITNWDDTRKLINIYGIAAGMMFLHSHNIIHRDLKSANILLDDKLFPKIADFGLSKIQNDLYTSQAGMKGTPAYMAPEILSDEKYSEASDVYAFGILVYEMLSLNTAFSVEFRSLTLDEFLDNIKNKKDFRPLLTPDIPEIYQNLIQACWDYSPEKRPTFKQIVDDLQTNDSFILETIERDEYENYIEFIESTKSSFNQNGLTQYGRNKPINYDDFIKKAKRRSSIKSVIIKFDDNSKIKKRSATVFGKPDIENSKEQIMNEDNNKDTDKHKKHKSKHHHSKKHKKNTSDTESNENSQEELSKIYDPNDPEIEKIKNFEAEFNVCSLSYSKTRSNYNYFEICKGKLFETDTNCLAIFFTDEYGINSSQLDSYISNNVKFIASIKHPSIIKFIGYKPDKLMMLTELENYYTIGDLNFQWIFESKLPMNWNYTKIAITIYGIASGLKFLHNHGIILCDIEPNGILLDDNFYPKISNFSFSEIKNDMFSSSSKLKFDSKYAYLHMAPEVMEKRMYSKYSDVYSFGVLVYEIFNHRNPFEDLLNTLYLPEFINKIVKEKYHPDFKCINQDYRKLVESCMSYIPEERPTFNQIVEDLKNLTFAYGLDENEGKYYEYIELIEESESSFNPNVFIYFDKYFYDKKEKEIKPLPEMNDSTEEKLIIDRDNDPEHLFITGKNYIEGTDCTKNIKLGIKYLENSISLNCLNAVVYYCKMLTSRKYGKCNYEKAFSYLFKYSESSDPRILDLFGKLYIGKEYYSKAKEYLEKGCSIEDPICLYHYGKMIFKAEGCSRDNQEVIKYLTMAKNKGHEKSGTFLTIWGKLKEISSDFDKIGISEQLLIIKHYLKYATPQEIVSNYDTQIMIRNLRFHHNENSYLFLYLPCSYDDKFVNFLKNYHTVTIEIKYPFNIHIDEQRVELIKKEPLNIVAIATVYTMKSIDSPFIYNDIIDVIHFEPPLEIIKDSALMNYKTLKNVSFPSTLKTIDQKAFSGCSSLKEVSIPSSVTKIGAYAFSECSSLHQVFLSSSIKSIEVGTFSECSSLSQIIIPLSVTLISKYSFYKCNSLRQIIIPSSVTEIENNAFEQCTLLEQVSISSSSLNKIETEVFKECSSLMEIVIPSSVSSIASNSFYNCSSMRKIAILSSQIDVMKDAFDKCIALEQISIPKDLKLDLNNIGIDPQIEVNYI